MVLETSEKKTETRGKIIFLNFVSVKDGAEKDRNNEGRDERIQEDYPTSAAYYFCKCRGIFLHSFISALIVSVLFQLHLRAGASQKETVYGQEN